MREIENPVALEAEAINERREALKRLGRYAAVSAPAVTLLLAALGKPTKAVAISVLPEP